MNKSPRVFVILVLLAIALTACAAPGSVPEGKLVVIEPAPNPITAKLKVGDVLELRLPTIPAEGYTWKPQDLDAKILRQEGEAEYIADKGPNASGGVTTVRFKALAAGSTSLTLIYANPKAASRLGLSSQSFGLSVEVESGD